MRCPAALLAALIAGPALADTTAVTPVYGQLVVYPVPPGFGLANEAEQDGYYIQESIPQGENLQGWSQMVTLTGAAGAGDMPPQAWAENLAARYQAACPDTFGAAQLPAPQVPGARAVFAAYLGCGEVAGQGHGEEMIVLIIAGTQDLYSLQWAERFAPLGGPAAYDPGIWDLRLQFWQGGVALCDPVPGEEAPYPSCTGG